MAHNTGTTERISFKPVPFERYLSPLLIIFYELFSIVKYIAGINHWNVALEIEL